MDGRRGTLRHTTAFDATANHTPMGHVRGAQQVGFNHPGGKKSKKTKLERPNEDVCPGYDTSSAS
jgi:hypothetical protein